MVTWRVNNTLVPSNCCSFKCLCDKEGHLHVHMTHTHVAVLILQHCVIRYEITGYDMCPFVKVETDSNNRWLPIMFTFQFLPSSVKLEVYCSVYDSGWEGIVRAQRWDWVGGKEDAHVWVEFVLYWQCALCHIVSSIHNGFVIFTPHTCIFLPSHSTHSLVS